MYKLECTPFCQILAHGDIHYFTFTCPILVWLPPQMIWYVLLLEYFPVHYQFDCSPTASLPVWLFLHNFTTSLIVPPQFTTSLIVPPQLHYQSDCSSTASYRASRCRIRLKRQSRSKYLGQRSFELWAQSNQIEILASAFRIGPVQISIIL